MVREKLSILLISPDESDRERMERSLGDEFVIHGAATLSRGIEAMVAETPDCVVVDFLRPGEDRRAALRKLVKYDTAVVVVVDRADDTAGAEALQAGATDYVTRDHLGGQALRHAVLVATGRRAFDDCNRALLRAIPGLIVRVHRDGALLDCVSSEIGTSYSFSGKFLPTNIRDVLSAAAAEAAMANVERALDQGGVQHFEYELESGGTTQSFESRITACGRDQVVAIAWDVTELKRLERNVRGAQRMETVGRLAAGVAHDFNNVLTAVATFIELIKRAMRSGEPVDEDLRQILLAVERGARLTRQLLAFSRRQAQNLQVVDLNRVIADLLDMVQPTLGEHIQLVVKSDRGLGSIEADLAQIEQIVVNLAVNARDAMPDGGTLTIETANIDIAAGRDSDSSAVIPPGSYVVLLARDTGVGMDRELQSRIFEPFFTTKPRGQGTGLGLSTVYGIVRQSRGFVRVDSEPGRGSSFEIYLPRVDKQATGRRPRHQLPESVLGTETILLVEDSAPLRTGLRRLLLLHGYCVIEAEDGSEALAIAMGRDEPIHLMLADVIVPYMNVRVLTHDLTARWPGMRTLYISGYTDSTIAHHGVLQHGVAFLQKPFSPDMLLRKIRRLLDS
ncbi:MAG: response regulator [Proteobacteria bacterium]|nr:response regulator [Pseudomonadota bacterium]